jgi:hypothetical protein
MIRNNTQKPLNFKKMQKKNQKNGKHVSKAEFLVMIDKFFDNIKTREQAIEFMQKVGTLDKDGKLTKNYGG